MNRLECRCFCAAVAYDSASTDACRFCREEELAGRIEVLEKLRASMRELERDKRDAFKRYREQVSSRRASLVHFGLLI